MTDTVLLVIDTQKGIMDDRLFEFEKISRNIKNLIDTARKNSVEVVFVQHDDGAGSGFSVGDEDFEIFDDFKPKESERVFVKSVNSALHKSTGLCEYLLEKGVKQIITVGLQTNFCIDATIRTGFDAGFKMIVPEYANSTFSNDYMSAAVTYHYYNDFLWKDRFANCVSMAEAVKILEAK